MSSPDIFDGSDARIIDRGYRHYSGPRTGIRGAMLSVTRYSIQRGLGMRRTIWAKILPIATAVIAYLPAVVLVGMVALLSDDSLGTDFILPSYGDYYGYVITAIMLFVSFAAPEMLCTDRRSGMLGIYLASPLDRDSYLVAKGIAVALVLSIVCIGPTLLMLSANVIQGQGPDGFGETITTTAKVLWSGLLVTLLYTGVTMGVASLTDRKTLATAGTIMLFLVSLMVAGIFAGTSNSDDAHVMSVTTLSLEVASRAHGETSTVIPSVNGSLVALAWILWTGGGFGLAWYRIRTVAVTR